MKTFFSVLKKYAVFSGRASRSEFWVFYLIWGIIYFVLSVIDLAIGTEIGGDVGILSFVYLFATILPAYAVQVRRLHDTGRSGWWSLLNSIPIIGTIVVIFFLAQDSQQGQGLDLTGPNKYGPNPKEPAPVTEL
jgi:uncharacterized membrane protein YhaH (DUF805 family)